MILSIFSRFLAYGISHGSVIEMRRDRAKSNAVSDEDGDANASRFKDEYV